MRLVNAVASVTGRSVAASASYGTNRPHPTLVVCTTLLHNLLLKNHTITLTTAFIELLCLKLATFPHIPLSGFGRSDLRQTRDNGSGACYIMVKCP